MNGEWARGPYPRPIFEVCLRVSETHIWLARLAWDHGRWVAAETAEAAIAQLCTIYHADIERQVSKEPGSSSGSAEGGGR